ncbi:hypothetical protein A3K81_03965 [Candidatus Bathyarchaeota archaeon RBG_13_60_20]|nr:MAG: hypothetical protein A3K81_03965 [Candidatus Bathyarchaeota archaeon RBG_13_60_20]
MLLVMRIVNKRMVHNESLSASLYSQAPKTGQQIQTRKTHLKNESTILTTTYSKEKAVDILMSTKYTKHQPQNSYTHQTTTSTGS